MAADLSADSIIRAGSGLLYVLLGLAIAARPSASKSAKALGAFAVSFGFGFILFNLFAEDPRWQDAAVRAVALSYVVLFLAAVAVAVLLPPALRRERWAFVAVGALFAVYIMMEWGSWGPDWVAVHGYETYGLFGYLNAFQVGSVVLLPLLCALRLLRAGISTSTGERETLPLLALTFGPYVGLAAGADALGPPQTAFASTPDAALALLAVVLATSAIWLWCAARTPSRLVLLAALAPLAAALIGMGAVAALGHDQAYDLGLIGVARILGWLALLRLCSIHPAIGLKLPGLRANRSAVAMGALAALFIVAQVVQNFFSAKFGLLSGGVIAGTFLFAASPVQKAIERAAERRGRYPSPPTHRQGEVMATRREEVYLAALRVAMRDRNLTREEEVDLHRLAEELGIGAGRAHELMVGVEGERVGKRRTA